MRRSLDRAVHVRKPAWPFLMGPRGSDLSARKSEGGQRPPQWLHPNWDAVKPRVQGFPAFALFINARWGASTGRLATARVCAHSAQQLPPAPLPAAC